VSFVQLFREFPKNAWGETMNRNVFLLVLSCLALLVLPTAGFADDPPVETGAKRDTLLYVKTVPPGAKVLLDGRELGTSDGMFHVDPGVGTIEVELKGHQAGKKKIAIRAEGVTRIELTLKPEKTASGDVIQEAISTISQCTEADPRVGDAMKSLQAMKQSQVVAGLTPYLDSPVDTVRRSAIFVLWRGKFADISPTVPMLQKLLTHEEVFTRGMAALALGQNKVSASYDALVKMTTSDKSGYARRCGAIALGWLGDKRAEPTLEAALKDKDPTVQKNASFALELLRDKTSSTRTKVHGHDLKLEGDKNATEDVVVEGVGWRGFHVGATREELVKTYGEPESNPDPQIQWLKWTTKHHVDCLIDNQRGAFEIRFNKGFSLALASGVKIDSSEEDVLSAYGAPDRVVNQSQSKMLEYDKRGVLMWITDGKVVQFTIFKPRGTAAAASNQLRGNLRDKARKRMQQDAQMFSDDERREIETLYQVANKKWQTQEARDNLEKLVEKYKNANRTGCAILYLGQMSRNDEQIAYLKQAIADHSDCFFGDGVQVGAFARFLLGNVYLQKGNAEAANELFEELRTNYPEAIDHSGNSLVAQLSGGNNSGSEQGFVAAQLREAKAGNYWAKYKLWAAYHKGTDGVQKNPEEAEKWLAEVVRGVYLAKFKPIKPFDPTTPMEFLTKFNEHSSLASEPRRIGGASFFRTTVQDGVLIGSFLTEYPDKMRKAIVDNPSLKFISIEKLTPEMFIAYEASPQESLKEEGAKTEHDQEAVEPKAGGGNAAQLSQEGWNLWKKGEMVEAVAKFRQAVKLDPKNEKALNGLGWASFNSGNRAEAEKAFLRLVELNPRHPAALNGLGQLYFAQRKYKMAEKYLLKAAPQAPAAWYGLAKLYLLQGKYEQAEKYAQRIIDAGQADDGARLMLKAAKEKHLNDGLRITIEPPAADTP